MQVGKEEDISKIVASSVKLSSCSTKSLTVALREKFSGPYLPVFGLNTEIYGVNLLIQSGYRKIWTGKYFLFGHFSHSVADSSSWTSSFSC